MQRRILLNFALIILLAGQYIMPVVMAQGPADPAVETLFNRLTLEEKIGQLFIVPFTGNDASPGSDISVLLTEYKIGGVVLQTSNNNFSNDATTPHQIATLTNQLQAQTLAGSAVPLFIAIDYEGDGWPYTRITGGVTPIPSPMSIGATWNLQNARDVGRLVGQELSAMGINMLLGPVLDVLNAPRPTGRGDMGTRTFGGDPFWVGAMGRATIQGVHEGSNRRIVTVAKHFPGHGGSDRLPDNEVATVDKSLQELKRIELAPFFAVTNPDSPGQTDAMMSSHIRYRGFQGDIRQFTAPISFDKAGMTTLLNLPEFVPWRAAGGLIVSDALGVPAVRKHFDPTLQTFPHRRIAREAFLAGNDLLILAQFDLDSVWSRQFENIKDTVEYFRGEYAGNSEFAARVDESVRRILAMKLKLFPNPSPNALFVDGDVALAVAGRGEQIVNRIARQSLTLLYPEPESYKIRLARPPAPAEKLLIVSDSRLVRECFEDSCRPFEPLPYNALEKTILALYGPEATAQVQAENIDSITFTELKQVLVGSLAQTTEEATPDAPEIRHTARQVTDLIQQADWIIFATQDLNTDRYPASDALKLFLAQGLPSLYNKKLIVFALNSPYYLDTTEISKLTACFGLYSKTAPHLEVAVRTLFGETTPQGAAPVTVDSIGYDLVSLLAPDPAQPVPLLLLDVSPPDHAPPVSVSVQAGPILDHNGHPVPDGTSIRFEATYSSGQNISVPVTTTVNGMARADFTLKRAGSIEITAVSGNAKSAKSLVVTVMLPPANTPTASPAPGNTPTVRPSATATATATATPAPQPSPSATPIPSPTVAPQSPAPEQPGKNVTGVDLLIALAAIALSSVIGLLVWSPARQSINQMIRLGLTAFIGGMSAYLLYGPGRLRPDVWLNAPPSVFVRRGMLSVLVLVFGLLGILAGRAARRWKKG